ncbi:hypothetical protein BPNPMPFG_004275 [Mesorhizobium sp. AR07]|uniref:hypothetical protein n=1 Tax=Mesorhizobium sp. AR07 TaxID=2865838 RepID=UPI00216097FA|nr:hypothetical protein [Mesorhizobium sp. AR07]UVK42580.1 hypothetical protein BPNPMPFG_004275 [Mesorhizobium sp. AR07]
MHKNKNLKCGLGRYLVPLALLATPADSQEFDPTSVDVTKLIECKASVSTYNNFAFWISDGPVALETLGWKEAASNNLFLKQYDLPEPVRAFGRQTRSIVFTATGPMAVLDGISAPDLAHELGMVPTVSTPEKFLGEKIIVESTEDAKGMKIETRIALNVSTVDSHPGKTLAGCSYVLNVK